MKKIKDIKKVVDKEINVVVDDYLKKLKTPNKKLSLKQKIEFKIMKQSLNQFSEKDLKFMIKSKIKKKFDKKIKNMKINDTLMFIDNSKIIKKEDGYYVE